MCEQISAILHHHVNTRSGVEDNRRELLRERRVDDERKHSDLIVRIGPAAHGRQWNRPLYLIRILYVDMMIYSSLCPKCRLPVELQLWNILRKKMRYAIKVL